MMTRITKVLGEPVPRIDGTPKVTGKALYSSDVTYPDLTHAVFVQSTIAAGIITQIDTRDAMASPGVHAVLTHENAPLASGATAPAIARGPALPFRDRRIWCRAQPIAIVVADTPEQARAAARLVSVDYEESAPVLGIGNAEAEVLRNPWGLEVRRGDVDAALSSAHQVFDETFSIAAETNSPMGLFATVARWDGNRLVVHDSTQWAMAVRSTLASVFDIPEQNVRVLAPYVGGGFGAGLRVWPHVILTCLAARVIGSPVKMVLTRPQMFTILGYRPESLQRLRVGVDRDARLVAMDQNATSTLSMDGSTVEPITLATQNSYACPNLVTYDTQVRLNIPTPGAMRAPGTASGNFAIESALDEIAWKLGIDPIELRMRNYAEVQPQLGLPWSSKALKECYRLGAERFGWSKREQKIGATRDGYWLVGSGMASVNYEWYAQPCRASITIHRDGTARIRTSGTDIGTGTYTIVAQIAAELLGLDVRQVKVDLGDSDLPPAPQSGGSGLSVSIAGAIQSAVDNLARAFLDLVKDDQASPLAALGREDAVITDGRIHASNAPDAGEAFAEILHRHDRAELTVEGTGNPQTGGTTMAPSPAFAAHFAEVRVDHDLGLVRVSRIVSVVDGGRILNRRLARSQIIGGVIMGIGMALMEETIFDPTGRIANATFSDYLIPTNADIGDIDVSFVGEPDRLNALGVKGIGEIGTVGVAAAIANAVFHATGRRVRSLPITVEKIIS